MKNIRYLLLCGVMVISSVCWGQKKDSVISKVIGSGTEIFPKTQGQLFAESKSNQDTLKVLMLVCDTMGYPHTSVGSVLPSSQAWNEGRMVWWQFGYEVKQDLDELNKQYGDFWYKHYWSEAIYLDENKKPLPKSIVVWMTKEIK